MSEEQQQQPAAAAAESSVLRVGFIGASGISHKIWAAIEAAGSMQVTMVGARDAARAAAFIQTCKESLSLPDSRVAVPATYEEVVASPNVDVVYISIPVTKRNDWVLRCAENGKHVVGEKPPAKDGDELRHWLEVLAEKKLLYMDGTMFSHGPYIESVSKNLSKVGTIRRMTANNSFVGPEEFHKNDIRTDPALEPMGSLGDSGWYCVRCFLHAMNFAMPTAVVGRVVQANAKGGIVAFSGELTFTSPSNSDEVVTALFYCSSTSSDECDLVISGTEGTIIAPQIMMPVTDRASSYSVVKTVMTAVDTEMKVKRAVEKVEVPQETGHLQETQLWRDVRDSLRKSEDGTRLVADDAERHKWGKAAWITQCILDKLMESAGVTAAPAAG